MAEPSVPIGRQRKEGLQSGDCCLAVQPSPPSSALPNHVHAIHTWKTAMCPGAAATASANGDWPATSS
eukprot:366149-Chlamydomonas_euryale.AAC.13